MTIRLSLTFWAIGILFSASSMMATADETSTRADRTIKLGEGAILMTAPAEWTSKEPAARIIDYEFAVPALKGGDADARGAE